MRKLISLLPLFTLLSGCATYAPGDDQKGLQLQAIGQEVLMAARMYMDQNARPPHTLQDLVPKYMAALPIEPSVTYDAKAGRFEFVYKQEGTQGSQVACHAVIGETDWICTGVYTQKQ